MSAKTENSVNIEKSLHFSLPLLCIFASEGGLDGIAKCALNWEGGSVGTSIYYFC